MESLIETYKNNLIKNLNIIDNEHKEFNKNILNKISEEEKEYIKLIESKNNTIDDLETEINSLNGKYNILNKKYEQLQDDCNEFEKVSIMKNLNKQLHEKNLECEYLTKQLNKYKNIVKDFEKESVEEGESLEEREQEEESVLEEESVQEESVQEESVVEESVQEESVQEESEEEESKEEESEEEESEEEEECELIEKKLKCPKTKKFKLFYITDDINRDIYEIENGDEVGEHLGKMIKNKPHFFN